MRHCCEKKHVAFLLYTAIYLFIPMFHFHLLNVLGRVIIALLPGGKLLLLTQPQPSWGECTFLSDQCTQTKKRCERN